MLRDGEPNPLNIYGNRQIEGTCPPHFTQVKFDLYIHQSHKEFADWIWENLEGRFWIGDIFEAPSKDQSVSALKVNHKVDMYVCAAFESPGEATMFAMCKDQISRPNHL